MSEDQNEVMKECSKCGKILPLSRFYRIKTKIGYRAECKKCHNDRMDQYKYDHGIRQHYYENKSCAAYMGVYVTERLLHNVFQNVSKSPHNTPGYDFVCGKGYKVDAKSCTVKTTKYGKLRARFDIRKNHTADYFACVVFNNRTELEPIGFWVIPGEKVRHLKALSFGIDSLKWRKYQKPVNKLIQGCQVLRGEINV